jgi:predicted nucleotide-binding protein
MAGSRRQQALYGKPVAPVPAPGPPALTRARAEVTAELQERIALGKEIQERFSFRDDVGTYKSDVQRWRDYNLLLLQTVFTNHDIMIEYRRIVGPSRGGYTETEVLQTLREDVDHQITKLESILERLGLYPEAVSAFAAPAEGVGSEDRSKVFVVHGHDEGAREAVARFIRDLGFQPIILHERANEGRTVIEKVEAHGDVGFAVVLLTPDDEGCEKCGTPGPRARQNVVLELGYFVGRLGRNRVCALKRGELEIPSDFGGVVYEPFDAADGWKQKLGRELEAAGYEIDWNTAMRA